MGETFVVPRERAGMELDEFLCLQFPGTTKGFLRNQVRDGLVLVDGTLARPSQRLRTDQVLWVEIDEEVAPAPPVAPAVGVEILRETDSWLVVNKPAGLAVEPERWARTNASLSGGLLALALSRGGDGADVPHRFRLVHRIDKDTSGAVLVAKDLETERFFRRSFDEGTIHKSYDALVEGEHPLADGEEELIDLPLGPDERKSGRMVVRRQGGKPSRTRIAVAERFRGYTLMRCEPLTGRTHQIRVHLRESGFPLAVDPVYGRRDALFLSEIKSSYKAKPGRPERPLLGRLALHARVLSVPTDERSIDVEAPYPKDFANTVKQLRKVRAWKR